MQNTKTPRARAQQIAMGTDYEFVMVPGTDLKGDEESWLEHDCYIPDQASGRLVGRVLSSRFSKHTLMESLFIKGELRKLSRPIHYPSRKDAAAALILVDIFAGIMENRSEANRQEPPVRENRDRGRRGEHRSHELPRAGVPKSGGGS